MQQPSSVFDPNHDYGYRQKIYSRASRTATLSRKKTPFSLNQLLLGQNQRWQGAMESIQESGQPQQPQYTYGANFNTDFNAQFDALPKPNSTTKSDTMKKDNLTTKPRRTICKNLPYRLLYRIRPSVRRQAKKPDFDYMPPSNLIRLFGETSLPGVRDIALSRSFLRRIFWICSFFFFGFLALKDISQLVSEYYTYPITVDVRLRDSRRLQFPAVTVCNLNIVRYSALCVTNVSVIKDSMIPRDLRDKLCGLQPAVATAVKESMPAPAVVSSTTVSPPMTTTKQSHKETHKPSSKKNIVPVTKASNQVLTTTVVPTESDAIDDINSYGVISKHKNGNETLKNGTTEAKSNRTMVPEVINGTTTETSTTVTTTSTASPIDIPNDISMPMQEDKANEPKERAKRRAKLSSVKPNSQVTNSTSFWSTELSTNQTSNIPFTDPPPVPLKQTKSVDSVPGQTQTQTPFLLENDIELTEREEKELQENLTNWLAVIYNSNEKIAKELGHQFEDFVLRCTIRSTNCTHPDSFEDFFTPTEGNCFTFKSQKLRTAYLDRIKDETSIAGVNYGLELVLNLEISEYLTGTTQIGAIIMIQHPDEIGISASEAIFVAPQQSTYIGLKMVNISRLPKPYPEECIDHWPAGLIGRLTQNASYSQQACLKICLQRTIHTRCKCQSAMLPQLELNSTLKICDTRRRSARKCVEEVMFQAEEKVSTCKCPPRCQVINYDKTVSMTKWPTREDKVTFDRGKANINFQNLAKVTVYFQTMTCQEVRQEKAYTTAKLFSSLGGILGMYVGFSFLSLFEIIEVFVRRFWYFITKKRSRFRAAVHTIRATFAFNPKRCTKGFDSKESKDSIRKVAQLETRRPSIVTNRYPAGRLNQTYQHGII